MAFRWSEFRRGALAALISFNVLFLPVATIIGAISTGNPSGILVVFFYVALLHLVYVLAISAAATVIGGCAAYGLGVLLRGVSSIRRHIFAFAGLGLLVGGIVILIVGSWPKAENDIYGTLLDQITTPIVALPLLALCAFSVAYGWHWTASRSLEADGVEQLSAPEGQLPG